MPYTFRGGAVLTGAVVQEGSTGVWAGFWKDGGTVSMGVVDMGQVFSCLYTVNVDLFSLQVDLNMFLLSCLLWPRARYIVNSPRIVYLTSVRFNGFVFITCQAHGALQVGPEMRRWIGTTPVDPLGAVSTQICQSLILGLWFGPLEAHKALLCFYISFQLHFPYSKIHLLIIEFGKFWQTHSHGITIVKIQSSSLTPQISPVPFCSHCHLCTQPLATIGFFSVSRVLPFPECYINTCIPYVAFCVWFLSHSMMHILVICWC